MNKEPITLHLETFNNEEYILADECIEAIGLHRRTNTELHQTIEEKDKEIKRLKEDYMILQNASDEVEEELQQRIDKAIEYIKFNATSNYFDAEKNMFRREIDLLEILGGSDKE